MNVGKVLLVLVGIWILFGIVGFLFKALFFLFVIALVGLGFTMAVEGRRRGMIGRR